MVLPLDELTAEPDLERWTLQVGAELDGVRYPAERTVAGYVEPSLAVGTALDDHLDVFPRLDRNGNVQLRTADAGVRVVAAHRDDAGPGVVVQLAAGSVADQLWWQDPQGAILERAHVDRDGRARLTLPEAGPAATLQLWAEGPHDPVRPRPAASFTTAVVGEGPDTERILRPTLVDGLVLEERRPRLTLARARLDDDVLQLAGPSPARALEHLDRIVLESVWSDAMIEAPVLRGPGRWYADLPLAALAAGSAGFETAWTWRVLAEDGGGTAMAVRTATEARATLPLRAVTPAAEVELRLGTRGTPRLLVGAPPPVAATAGTAPAD